MSVFMQPIYTQTLGTGVTTVTFNNIPQGYSDLKVVMSVRGTGAISSDAIIYTLNGGALQTTTRFGYDTSGVFTDRNSNNFGLVYGNMPSGNSTANTFGIFEMYFANYSGGGYKSWNAETMSVVGSGTTAYMMSWAGQALTTQPVQTMTFVASSGNAFASGTTFTVYGISQDYKTVVPTAPSIGAVLDQGGFASVSFTPQDGGQATSYAVTGSDGVTTYGVNTPIVTPVTVGTATTFTAKAINAVGTGTSSASNSVTSANGYVSLGTFAGTGSSFSAVTFSNIPQNYTHLQLRVFGRGTFNNGGYNDSTYLIFNTDGASNYGYKHTLIGNGSSASSANGGVGANLSLYTTLSDAGSIADVYGFALVDILDYKSTSKYKTVKAMGGADNNGNANYGAAVLVSSSWLSFQPISSITVSTDGSFAGYSHIALYGIA